MVLQRMAGKDLLIGKLSGLCDMSLELRLPKCNKHICYVHNN